MTQVLDDRHINLLQILAKVTIDSYPLDLNLSTEEWNAIFTLSRSHNILPLVFEMVSGNSSFISSPDYQSLMLETMTIVASQARRTDAFLNLYEHFIAENLHPIVMKGIICRQLYGEYCDHRPSGDEDILIQKSEYEMIANILTSNGYVSSIKDVTETQLNELQEITFHNDQTGLTIEVHVNPMGHDNDLRSKMNDYFVNVFRDSVIVNIEGIPIMTMNITDHFLYLVFHTFKHFTAGGFGVRQVLDIMLYEQKHYSNIEWNYVWKSLKEIHADRFFGDLVYIGNKYLGFNLPLICEMKYPDELLKDIMNCGVFGNETQEQRSAGFMIKGSIGSKSNSFEMLLKTMFPSKRQMINRFPELHEKPWLLPLCWLQRFVRASKYESSSNRSYVAGSLKISKRRIELLKKYDIL